MKLKALIPTAWAVRYRVRGRVLFVTGVMAQHEEHQNHFAAIEAANSPAALKEKLATQHGVLLKELQAKMEVPRSNYGQNAPRNDDGPQGFQIMTLAIRMHSI